MKCVLLYKIWDNFIEVMLLGYFFHRGHPVANGDQLNYTNASKGSANQDFKSAAMISGTVLHVQFTYLREWTRNQLNKNK
jgi:hypothetical protein